MVVVFAVVAMAFQGAGAAGGACTSVLNRSGQSRDIGEIEIDQILAAGDPMGIMAGRAGGLGIHDMKTVAPVLSAAVDRFEALVGQEAVAAVAFVTKGVIGRALGLVVRQHQ